MDWNLSEAKNRLSEVLDRVSELGPQTITRRDEAFVVMTAQEFEKRTGRKASFKAWLLKGPSLEGVKLKRDGAPMRGVEL